MSESPKQTSSDVRGAGVISAFLLIPVGFITMAVSGDILTDDRGNVLAYIAAGFGVLFVLAGFMLFVRDVIRDNKSDPALDLSATSSDFEHAVTQLAANYDILRRQATQGFVLAGTIMILGVLVIFSGLLGELFGLADTTRNLTSVAGIVLEVVSGLGLYLFKETSRRLDLTSERLHGMWKVLAAFKKSETLPEDRKTEVTIKLITSLVEMQSKPT